MYLSTDQSTALAESFRLLVNAQSLNELRQELGAPITRLLCADSMVSRDFDPLTSRYVIRVAHNIDATHAEKYDQYYQFCDPITPALKPLRCAAFTQAFEMRELKKTEFYNDFLREHGMHQGLNLYAFSGQQCVGDLLVFRDEARPEFEANDLEVMRLIEPSLSAAFRRLGVAAPTEALPQSPESDGRRVLVEVGLTCREADVALLVYRGFADKEIARALGVEISTVRYHLKNAGMKLTVSGRNRMAHAVSGLMTSVGARERLVLQ